MADTNGGRGNPGMSGPVGAEADRPTGESTASIGPAAALAAADAGDCGKHPGIVIRQGPTGPRAALSDGPDVWEVIVAMHAVHHEDAALQGERLRSELCTVTGLTAVQVSAALDYYAAHPTGVDERIAANDDAARRAQRPPAAGGLPAG
jgi:hypothetical protein